MASYIVMEPPQSGSGEARIFRDGFSLLAFLFAPFWLAWHRLWVEALLVLAAQILLGTLGENFGFLPAASVLSLLVSLYVALEASALRAAGLRRRGFSDWGVVDADSVRDAEVRYAVEVGAAEPHPSAARPATSAVHASPVPDGAPALGLLGYTGH
jgi:hypothetical protein